MLITHLLCTPSTQTHDARGTQTAVWLAVQSLESDVNRPGSSASTAFKAACRRVGLGFLTCEMGTTVPARGSCRED